MFFVLAFIVASLIALLIYKCLPGNYWKKLGVPYEPFKFPFGVLGDSILLKKHFGETIADLYRKYEGAPYIGTYQLNKPVLLVRDADLVRDIVITDFSHFNSNGIDVQENDLLSKNPFAMVGDDWKNARAKQIQCFTPAKLKSLVPSMQIIAERFVRYIEDRTEVQGPLEAREASIRFTVENVVNTSFGIEAKCFRSDASKFMKMSSDIFNPSIGLHLRSLIGFIFPVLAKYLDVRFIQRHVQEFFANLIVNIAKSREDAANKRNDFMGILIGMQEKLGKENMSTIDMVAHALSLFVDGTETSGNTISYVLYEIANNPLEQQKVAREVDRILEKHDGKLSYDAVQEMNYLECAIYESMRLHPVINVAQKRCTKAYKLPSPNPNEPNKTITIETGTIILLPIEALHMDEKYHPEPKRFNPERFVDENKNSMRKGTYLAFGDGPRACLGQRFAILQMKVVLAILLANFKLSVNEKTIRPLRQDPRYFMNLSKGGLWIDFAKRK